MTKPSRTTNREKRNPRQESTKRSRNRNRSIPEAGDTHGRVLMRLIHDVTALNAGRGTMDLSIRERLLIQRLGLEGPMPIAALGQRLSISPSSMTGLVDHLEAKGHVERRPHPTDRRAIELVLTRKGRGVFAREVGFYRTLVEETLAPLGSDALALVLRALMTLDRPESRRGAA